MHRTEALSSSFMLTHLDNQSNMRKHRDFWHGELQKKKKKKVFTPKMLTSLQKNQSINLITPGFLFHVSKWKHCVDAELQDPLFLLTVTPLQVQQNGKAEAQQPILYQFGCVAIIVCSHILTMKEEKIYSAKKMQFLTTCFLFSIWAAACHEV